MTTASALTRQEPETVLDSSARVPADTDPDPHSPDKRPSRRSPPSKGVTDIFFPGKTFKQEDISDRIAKEFKPFLDENLSPENRRRKALDLIEATGEDSDVSGLLRTSSPQSSHSYPTTNLSKVKGISLHSWTRSLDSKTVERKPKS